MRHERPASCAGFPKTLRGWCGCNVTYLHEPGDSKDADVTWTYLLLR
jgi:hypothetical protein